MRRLKWGLVAASVLMLLMAAQPAFATPPAGTPFQGRVYCATTGCNTDCSFACDSSMRPLTPFYIYKQTDPNCTANSYYPSVVYNSGSNQPIGVYIDNEVDAKGSFTYRQALVNCADQEARQLILVGEYPAETSADVQPTVAGYGDTVGNMLEWYPYCNGHLYYKKKQQYPPPLSSIGPNGYMSQGAFVPPGCRSGATTAEQSNQWNVEWGYVDGSSFTDPGGVTTIGDLLGTCEDSVC